MSHEPSQLNIYGEPLEPCSIDPATGFFRDGHCKTCPEDLGCHAVCALMTEEFLTASKEAGNDLSTPMPDFGFPGLEPGDRWCICAPRWKEAYEGGFAPSLFLKSCHQAALEYVPRSVLEEFGIDDVEAAD